MYNLIGRRFGDLLVLERSTLRSTQGKPLWLCRCDCGKDYYAITNQLIARITLSCGKCSYHTEHKDAYVSWMSAKSRVLNKLNPDYPNYGGRGITMSPKWLVNFKFFLHDMGDPPIDPLTDERLSIDRLDNNGNYCKENCRWATRSQQQLNKQRN